MAGGPEDFKIARERVMGMKRCDGKVGEEVSFLFLNHDVAARCRLNVFDVGNAATMGEKQGSDAAPIAQPCFGFGVPGRAVDEHVTAVTE